MAAKKKRTQKVEKKRAQKVENLHLAPGPSREFKPSKPTLTDKERLARRAARKLIRDEMRFKAQLETARKYFGGFSAKDGVKVGTLTKAQKARIKRAAGYVDANMKMLHVVKRPKTAAARRALRIHTGLTRRGLKAFPVAITAPGTRVKIIEKAERIAPTRAAKRKAKSAGKKPPRTRTVRRASIKLERDVKGTRIVEQFFYLPSKPKTPTQLKSMIRKMLKTMPDGFYSLQTGAYGDISRPVERDLILEKLETEFAKYEAEQFLTGFRYMGTNVDKVARESREIDKRRAGIRKARDKAKARERRQVEKRLKKKR
jgi:hypothetical protein